MQLKKLTDINVLKELLKEDNGKKWLFDFIKDITGCDLQGYDVLENYYTEKMDTIMLTKGLDLAMIYISKSIDESRWNLFNSLKGVSFHGKEKTTIINLLDYDVDDDKFFNVIEIHESQSKKALDNFIGYDINLHNAKLEI